MFVVKMKVQSDKDKNSIEWYLQGFDRRPLRFQEYGIAEREAIYQREKHGNIDGFSCVVLEDRDA